MKFIHFFTILFAFSTFFSCKDDGQVGSLIQPEEDLLHVYSNTASVKSTSLFVDNTLSKSEYFYLGEYTEPFFGRTKMEFISQIDSRLDGLTLPNTSVVTATSAQTGIIDTLLKTLDPKFGKILSIDEPTDFKVDSAFFVLNYDSNFFGDSTALQALKIYTLDKNIDDYKKYYTNTDVSEFCNKQNLIGSISYQIRNSRSIKVPVDIEFAKKLASIYLEGSEIKNQTQFNDLFKGVYVSHSFNGGGIIRISVAGFSIYYTYEAKIKTTYNGNDSIVNSKKIISNGKHLNILASNVFLSANKSVKRINLVSQPNLETTFNTSIANSDYSYTYTPAGIYTSVNIPFKAIVDSVQKYTKDTSKVMFNSARLKLWTKDIDWKTDMNKTSNSFVLLINKDSVIPFFASNKTPDGISSFVASLDTASSSYAFDITRAMQLRFKGNETFDDEMVIVPITRTATETYSYTYDQQLGLTATIFYTEKATEIKKSPRIDLVYTRRE